MKTSIEFQGLRDDDKWKHFAWRVTINGEAFNYRTGMGHATPRLSKKRKKPLGPCVTWVHIPAIDDILEALFLDVVAGSESFNEFCINSGYDSDSLKAFDIYRACMDIAARLRKALGAEFETERQRIEERYSG